MGAFQMRVFLLCLLILQQSLAKPTSSECFGEALCLLCLRDYYSQLVNLPSDINTRSIAPWVYHKNEDLNRDPQILYEARCQDSHSGGGCNSALGLETIPITISMPVLKRSPGSSYSVELENITVACICALSRLETELIQG
ncbi:interleukin-17A-like [Cyprinodon tularosa]|uniref:interleukin-17A-like n=1 Tax=Cyprinodon tularosa TaxID=77115 RepID=UPI000742661F|nr:PREDICTED: interleukin-17A-like isoform X1 [Cyprinodon variegatus]XP_038151069.1 interleukin-17A-like [Cyprinodon tularosa]